MAQRHETTSLVHRYRELQKPIGTLKEITTPNGETKWVWSDEHKDDVPETSVASTLMKKPRLTIEKPTVLDEDKKGEDNEDDKDTKDNDEDEVWTSSKVHASAFHTFPVTCEDIQGNERNNERNEYDESSKNDGIVFHLDPLVEDNDSIQYEDWMIQNDTDVFHESDRNDATNDAADIEQLCHAFRRLHSTLDDKIEERKSSLPSTPSSSTSFSSSSPSPRLFSATKQELWILKEESRLCQEKMIHFIQLIESTTPN